MRQAVCDKCGKATNARNPEAEGWSQVVVNLGTGEDPYADLCPDCGKEYAKVLAAAENTLKATAVAWLKSVITTNNQEENA